MSEHFCMLYSSQHLVGFIHCQEPDVKLQGASFWENFSKMWQKFRHIMCGMSSQWVSPVDRSVLFSCLRGVWRFYRECASKTHLKLGTIYCLFPMMSDVHSQISLRHVHRIVLHNCLHWKSMDLEFPLLLDRQCLKAFMFDYVKKKKAPAVTAALQETCHCVTF